MNVLPKTELTDRELEVREALLKACREIYGYDVSGPQANRFLLEQVSKLFVEIENLKK